MSNKATQARKTDRDEAAEIVAEWLRSQELEASLIDRIIPNREAGVETLMAAYSAACLDAERDPQKRGDAMRLEDELAAAERLLAQGRAALGAAKKETRLLDQKRERLGRADKIKNGRKLADKLNVEATRLHGAAVAYVAAGQALHETVERARIFFAGHPLLSTLVRLDMLCRADWYDVGGWEPLRGGQTEPRKFVPAGADAAAARALRVQGQPANLAEGMPMMSAALMHALEHPDARPAPEPAIDPSLLQDLPGSVSEVFAQIQGQRGADNALTPIPDEIVRRTGIDWNSVKLDRTHDGAAIVASLPKLNLLGEPPPARPVTAAAAPTAPAAMPAVDLSAPYIARLREGYEAAKAGNRDRRALRQLIERFSGPGFDVELIAESKVDAFLAEIKQLPEAPPARTANG